METELFDEKEQLTNYDYDAVIVLSALYKLGKKGYEFPTVDEDTRERAWGGKIRLNAAAELVKAGKTPTLILTGRNVLGEGKLSNAQAQSNYLQQRLHINQEALVLAEEDHYSTLGQARYLKKFLEKNKLEGKRVVLLTSAYHLPRAVRIFRREGLDLPFIAAEKILWQKSKYYQKLIRKLYQSSAMDTRRVFEKAGVRDLEVGTYVPQIGPLEV